MYKLFLLSKKANNALHFRHRFARYSSSARRILRQQRVDTLRLCGKLRIARAYWLECLVDRVGALRFELECVERRTLRSDIFNLLLAQSGENFNLQTRQHMQEQKRRKQLTRFAMPGRRVGSYVMASPSLSVTAFRTFARTTSAASVMKIVDHWLSSDLLIFFVGSRRLRIRGVDERICKHKCARKHSARISSACHRWNWKKIVANFTIEFCCEFGEQIKMLQNKPTKYCRDSIKTNKRSFNEINCQ